MKTTVQEPDPVRSGSAVTLPATGMSCANCAQTIERNAGVEAGECKCRLGRGQSCVFCPASHCQTAGRGLY